MYTNIPKLLHRQTQATADSFNYNTEFELKGNEVTFCGITAFPAKIQN